MKIIKKLIKTVCLLLAAVILIAGGYVAYVFIDYHRIGDMPLEPQNADGVKALEPGTYTVTSYNIGFGAYESDYGFFMDGGEESWAWSKERLNNNLMNIADFLEEQKSDFYLIQEVDTDSTRSYHTDERKYLDKALSSLSRVFAQNYDSPFLLYPLTQPHGASKSGLMTYSAAKISETKRVELPVEGGFNKLLDLDRCYCKAYADTADGKKLVIYNFHLSAYTSDGKIAEEQLKLILDDMEKEYAAGNYCLAGGDFNKDILGDSSRYFGKSDKEYTWAQPLPEGMLDGYHINLSAPIDEKNPVPSCRNADSAYHKGQYVLTIDGFLTSENLKVKSCAVINTGFAYSDHNPVKMEFEFVK